MCWEGCEDGGVDGEGENAIVSHVHTLDWCVVHLLYHLLLHTVHCRGVPTHPTG